MLLVLMKNNTIVWAVAGDQWSPLQYNKDIVQIFADRPGGRSLQRGNKVVRKRARFVHKSYGNDLCIREEFGMMVAEELRIGGRMIC